MIPQPILDYLNNMKPGHKLIVSQAKDPEGLVTAGKKYIDIGGDITFNGDYSIIHKDHPLPEKDEIYVYFDSN